VKTLEPVDPAAAPISAYLGILGLNGRSAYIALLDIGRPRPGETVVVSTAAGSVGSCVGQIAKIAGCRAVGIAGGADKVALCRDEFGYDAAVDYKGEPDLGAALDAACPDGIDVFFDNTGGAILDAVTGRINIGARIVVCGTAATANWNPPPTGPRIERAMLVNRAHMQGFLYFDHAHRFAEATARLAGWIDDGRLAYREDITEGIENAPAVLAGLYEGRNTGKALVRIRPDPSL
jgi:NADPH-dependent curcumin reductase CurA